MPAVADGDGLGRTAHSFQGFDSAWWGNVLRSHHGGREAEGSRSSDLGSFLPFLCACYLGPWSMGWYNHIQGGSSQLGSSPGNALTLAAVCLSLRGGPTPRRVNNKDRRSPGPSDGFLGFPSERIQLLGRARIGLNL